MIATPSWAMIFFFLGGTVLAGFFVGLTRRSRQRPRSTMSVISALFGFAILAGVAITIGYHQTSVQHAAALRHEAHGRHQAALRAANQLREELEARGDGRLHAGAKATFSRDFGIRLETEGPQDNSSLDEPLPVVVEETLYLDNGRVVTTKTLTEVPAWVTAPETPAGREGATRLLHSQRFATAGEAEAQLLRELRQQLPPEVFRDYPELQDRRPTLSDVKESGWLYRSAVVASPLKVGDFSETFYQVHWQVSFSDKTLERLLARWKPVVVQERLTWLAAAGGTATVLFALGALFLGWTERRHASPHREN